MKYLLSLIIVASVLTSLTTIKTLDATSYKIPIPKTKTTAVVAKVPPTVQPIVFNPNDTTTWPTCPAGDIVRADNGQCAVPYVPPVPVVVQSTPPAQSPVIQAVSGCGDDYYANLVYMRESGCSLVAVNASSGDCGIGQAAPCSKLIASCPDWQTDYTCQDNFFTAYMESRYGTWEASWNHELVDGWW